MPNAMQASWSQNDRTVMYIFQEADFSCLCCHFLFQRHNECANQEPLECNCGPLRDHILPPWAIYPAIKVVLIHKWFI